MSRLRAADDFEAIRVRLEELRRDRAAPAAGPDAELPQPEPDAAAHIPRHIRTPVPSTRRHPGSV